MRGSSARVLLVICALCCASLVAQDVPPSSANVRAPTSVGAPHQVPVGVVPGEPAALTVWNRAVTVLHADLGRFSAAQRARQAEDRILALPETSLFAPVEADEVLIGSLDAYTFSVDGRHLFSLYALDLDPGGSESLAEHAQSVRARLDEVLRARVEQRSLPIVLRGAGLAVAATVALGLVLWVVARLKGAGIKRVRRMAARSERLRVKQVDLRPYVADVLERVIGIVNLVLVFTTLPIWLGFCLELFPYTAPWGDRAAVFMTDLLHSTFHAVAAAVPDIVIVVLIAFVARGIARTITSVLQRVERRVEAVEGVPPESLRATRRIAVFVVWIFGLVFAYPYLPGSHSEAFKGVSVLLGLMVSLGSSGLVNQVMSGFVVLYSGAVRSGEVVRIGAVEGQVTELGFLSTKLLVPSGEEVSIPNAVVVQQTATNFSRGPGSGRAVASTTVTIGYDTPWRQVRALLLLAAQRTEGVVRDPAPRVSQGELGDFSVEYALHVQVVDGKGRAAVVSRLRAAIQDAFNEYGVQIMSPHFVAQPASAVLVPRGGEEPEPAPRFRFARESAPASFDPVEKAAKERAEREAREAEKAERVRRRAEAEEAGLETFESGPEGERGGDAGPK